MDPRDTVFLGRWLTGRVPPSRDQVLAFQDRRLRALVAHAHRDVPYYRRLFDSHGLRPEDVRGLQDLGAIPVSSKRDLQASHPPDLLARRVDPRTLLARTTTGSSGEPLTIRRSVLEKRILGAIWLRGMLDAGRRLRDRAATIAYLRPPDPNDKNRPLRTLQSVGLCRNVWVDCLRPPEEIVRLLERLRPDVVSGYPGVTSRVAALAPALAPGRIRPRLVTTAGEVLTTSMRAQISGGLGAPVVDFYASHELNLIARECPPAGGYHVCEAAAIVEVLRDGRPVPPGERGEVVVTSLHAFAMPFLRYRLGDVVTRGADRCPCGAKVSTLRAIQGRMIDYFPLPDGRLLHPYAIVATLLAELGPWVRQYQITQERDDRVVLRMVTTRELPADRLGALQLGLRRVLGPGVRAEVALLPEIDLERTGKFRVSRSLVGSGYDEVDWARVEP